MTTSIWSMKRLPISSARALTDSATWQASDMIPEEAIRHETVLDNVRQRVARIYAEALLRAAASRQQGAEVLSELQAIVGDVFRRAPDLESFLSSPAVGRDR